MPRITPLAPDNAPAQAQSLIEQSKQLTGGAVLNVFRQMSVSPTTFEGYLNLAGTLQQGALARTVQEAIAVGVSDFDGCTY